jgi:Ala-tRNA(Pro) deacylase
MMKNLGITPGSVSPFGLLHDSNKHVASIIEAALKHAHHLSFHPNLNTASHHYSCARFFPVSTFYW